MRTAVFIPFALATAIAVYWWLIRPVLRRWAALAPAWAEIDAREGRLAKLFCGLKTRLAAALVGLSSALLSLHDWILPYLTGVDWSPVTAQLPPWAWLLVTLALSVLFGWLRSVTFGPPAKV